MNWLTGSPRWPGWPGNPSFPAGPWKERTKNVRDILSFILSKSFLSLLVTYIWSLWPSLSIASLRSLRALKQSGRSTGIHLSPAMKRNVKSHISLVDWPCNMRRIVIDNILSLLWHLVGRHDQQSPEHKTKKRTSHEFKHIQYNLFKRASIGSLSVWGWISYLCSWLPCRSSCSSSPTWTLKTVGTKRANMLRSNAWLKWLFNQLLLAVSSLIPACV